MLRGFRLTNSYLWVEHANVQYFKIFISFSEHYCDQIYEAILLATTRSLVTLAESSGCEGDVIRATSALSDAPSGTRVSSAYKSREDSPSRVSTAQSGE